MKNIIRLFWLLMAVTACSHEERSYPMEVHEGLTELSSIQIPLGGNTWVSGAMKLSASGISNWASKDEFFHTWFSLQEPGKWKLSLHGTLPTGPFSLKVRVAGYEKDITEADIQNDALQLGEFTFTTPGYVQLEVRGISKSSAFFGEYTHLKVTGPPILNAAYVPDNEGNAFYWARRGPSVHLRYETAPEDQEIEWYYGEIEVPLGNDVIGSYFMAHGFNGGYFGFQVNAENERRILFSVWSPYQTDNPKDIPEEERIKLHAKGREVYTGEFGNEGSGGQSYLRYMWSAGQPYAFLLRGEPLGNNYTRYTAWFYATDEQEWRLIASFERPKTNSYLKGWYSFLENFNPETGPITRMAYYRNQWYRDASSENWRGVSRARFTADNTARQNWRSDYAGGVQNQAFFLKNCGFFFPGTPFDQDFQRPVDTKAPVINLESLPME